MRYYFLRLLFFLLVSLEAHAMLFDNRYFFIFRQPIKRLCDQRLNLVVEPFAMQATSAFDRFGQTCSIPSIQGTYNQALLAQSLVEAKISPDPLLPSAVITATSVIWDLTSKIDAQGFAMRGAYRFLDYFEVGAGIYAMHGSQTLQSVVAQSPDQDFGSGLLTELQMTNMEMRSLLGLNANIWTDVAFGDPYLYGRIGKVWDYTAKCKRIDLGISLGCMFPLAPGRNIFNPASLPLGGNGHFGVYGAIDGQFELKEDWTVGFECILLNRLEKERCVRFPFVSNRNKSTDLNTYLDAEPLNFGIEVKSARVEPGLTFYFAPYASLERLRDGFGVRAMYHLIKHKRDDIQIYDKVNFYRVRELSRWGADYITASVFYDFGYHKEESDGSPMLTFSWDVPVNFLEARNVSKTNIISLTFEVGF